jgi:glycosyltransferase involved in cell wall biosynthesis
MSYSLITSVYNAEKYLNTSLDSVIYQLSNDDEWIVVDDASNDHSNEILVQYSDKITLIKNKENLKLPESLNKAVVIAGKKYIARMDADDICEPSRFKIQENFLDKNPEIGIVGTTAWIIDEDGKKIRKYKLPTDHIRIKWKMLFSNPLIHPSVMARTWILKENPYNTDYPNSQDYELWCRLMFEKGIKFANIKRPLLRYRIHNKSATATKNLEKKKLSLLISLNNIKRYIKLSDAQKDFYSRFRLGQAISFKELLAMNALYFRIFVAFTGLEKPSMKNRILLFSDLLKSFIFSLKQFIKQLLKI